MTPLATSLVPLQEGQKDRVFQQDLVTSALDQVLLGLDFLHDADVIHTGMRSDLPPYQRPLSVTEHAV